MYIPKIDICPNIFTQLEYRCHKISMLFVLLMMMMMMNYYCDPNTSKNTCMSLKELQKINSPSIDHQWVPKFFIFIIYPSYNLMSKGRLIVFPICVGFPMMEKWLTSPFNYMVELYMNLIILMFYC
jgi:hypothetical protein